MMKEGWFQSAIKLIKKWSPKNYRSEAKFQTDLVKYLRGNLKKGQDFGFGSPKKAYVEKEGRRKLADIQIEGDEVGIELKYNFRYKSQVQRLESQIREYKDVYDGVIVVFVGSASKTKRTKIEEAKRKINKMRKSAAQYDFSLEQKRIKFIDKSGKKTSSKKKEGKKESFSGGWSAEDVQDLI